MPKLTVALVSPEPRLGDLAGNLLRYERFVARAAGRGAELVAFPELALCGYANEPGLRRTAEPIPGPSVAALEKIARRHGVYLSMGMLEKSGPHFFIAQVVIGPGGCLGRYRKVHPGASERKYLKAEPGDAFPVFDINGIKMGINICADSRHADTLTPLSRRGVELLHSPHANTLPLGAHAEEWTRGKLFYYVERALGCRAHILTNNLAGSVVTRAGGKTAFGSGAMILNPLGQVVARTVNRTRTEKMLVATIDTNLAKLIPEFEIRRLKRGAQAAGVRMPPEPPRVRALADALRR